MLRSVGNKLIEDFKKTLELKIFIDICTCILADKPFLQNHSLLVFSFKDKILGSQNLLSTSNT